jgi:hypothetical protein
VPKYDTKRARVLVEKFDPRLRAARSVEGWETARDALSVQGRPADRCRSSYSGHDPAEERTRSTLDAGMRQTRLSLPCP